MRFTAKEWTSLADGEYLFSIDTGSLPVGAADSTSYCVSQRLKIVNEAVVSLVGCSHGSPLPPAANQIALSRAARLGCPEAARSGVANVQESDSESDSESDEAQQYLFAVPLIECARHLPRACPWRGGNDTHGEAETWTPHLSQVRGL